MERPNERNSMHLHNIRWHFVYYPYYDGNISFLANVALKMGWVKLPSFIEKRSGNEIVINLRCVPSFSRSFELQDITFYNNEVHVKLNIKKVL